MPDVPSDADGWVAPVISLFGSGRRETGAPTRVPEDDGAGPAPERAAARPVRSLSRAEDVTSPGPDDGHEPAGASRTEKAAERAERRARNVSFAALARRGMSVAELRDRLAERGIEPDEIEAELDRLQDARYLDDAALAESVIRTETERKGRGRSAVAAELRRRRVDSGAIEAALESLDDEGELERAVAVAEQRARQLRSYDSETARRRLYGFLQRRGFSGSVLQHAVDTALAGQD